MKTLIYVHHNSLQAQTGRLSVYKQLSSGCICMCCCCCWCSTRPLFLFPEKTRDTAL